MIASLPMYDTAATRAANDTLWAAIRDALGHGPLALTRTGDPWDHWRSPDLLLSQTCGLPFRARLAGQVELVGTPDYGLPGCPAGHYCSVILCRRGAELGPTDYPSAVLALNDALSQSGWAAAQAHAAMHGTGFGRAILTGAHHDSARAVAEGRADIAFVDAVTWRLIAGDPGLAGLAVTGQTRATPGLPMITAAGRDADRIAGAVRTAIAAVPGQVRDAIGIRGLVAIPVQDYLALPIPPEPPISAALGEVSPQE